jgi:hypothetical protein
MNSLPQTKFKNPRARHDFKGRTCSIAGVGSYVPEQILTNADLEKMVDTSDEWITTRTGIGNGESRARMNLRLTSRGTRRERWRAELGREDRS